MPYRACANCGLPARLLDVSRDSVVDYYRCDACGEVWTHDRADSESAPRRVTFSKPPNSADRDSQPPAQSGANVQWGDGVHPSCPQCDQMMVHVGVLPAEGDVTNRSDIYRCATDGYWRVYDSGRIEHLQQR